MTKDENLIPEVIMSALHGSLGPNQKRIAEKGLEWLEMLIRKNIDYGSSVWKRPILAPDMTAEASIRVRMSDKISRLQRLLQGNEGLVKESVVDTVTDLGAYCLLWVARPED